MKLRNLTVYDKHGQDSDETLQYWDDENKIWRDVPSIRISYQNLEKANEDPDWT